MQKICSDVRLCFIKHIYNSVSYHQYHTFSFHYNTFKILTCQSCYNRQKSFFACHQNYWLIITKVITSWQQKTSCLMRFDNVMSVLWKNSSAHTWTSTRYRKRNKIYIVRLFTCVCGTTLLKVLNCSSTPVQMSTSLTTCMILRFCYRVHKGVLKFYSTYTIMLISCVARRQAHHKASKQPRLIIVWWTALVGLHSSRPVNVDMSKWLTCSCATELMLTITITTSELACCKWSNSVGMTVIMLISHNFWSKLESM